MSDTAMAHVLYASAPANLLVMGEYAVLEEGGLGLAIAPDIRVTGTLTTSTRADDPVSLTGLLPGATVAWPGDTGLLGRAADHLLANSPHPPTGAAIEIDSTSLFGQDGEKLGLGSSAAAVVLLAALWMAAISGKTDVPGGSNVSEGSGERQGQPPDMTALFSSALDAHRSAQGGRGSGYDVACSVLGGTLLFTGGESPDAKRVELPWFPSIDLFPGRKPVGTVSAVGRYREWKKSKPARAAEFLRESNTLVAGVCGASSWSEARPALLRHRDLAIELGEAIGVSATIEPPPGISAGSGTIVKAVGAGNELGIVMAGDDTGGKLTRLRIADEGILWG